MPTTFQQDGGASTPEFHRGNVCPAESGAGHDRPENVAASVRTAGAEGGGCLRYADGAVQAADLLVQAKPQREEERKEHPSEQGGGVRARPVVCGVAQEGSSSAGAAGVFEPSGWGATAD